MITLTVHKCVLLLHYFMAVERQFDLSPIKNEPLLHSPKRIPSSVFSCAVFGDGLWSCPADCPNIEVKEAQNFADTASKCLIVSTDLNEYTHPELIDFGVSIRQPGQKLFIPLLLTRIT